VSYPSPPWELRGPVLLVPALVDARRAAELVPADMSVAPAAGQAVGGILVASYGGSSTLAYNEVLTFCGVARRGRSLGLWISEVYVDSEASRDGGRELWWLPKELARIRIQGGRRQRVEASREARPLLSVVAGRAPLRWPQPAVVPFFGSLDGGVRRTVARGTLRLGPVRARTELGAETVLASIGARPSPVALAGEASMVFPGPSVARASPAHLERRGFEGTSQGSASG
jgi:Acetoacetate decarboxylase (ADC)